MIGGTVARLSVAAGHQVIMSNSRGPVTLTDLAAGLGPLARAASAQEAAAQGDIVVVLQKPGSHHAGYPGADDPDATRRRSNGRPVVAASVVMGIAMEPKATGAVLKISTKTSASRAGNPIMISNELVMATGVPKPAMPSSKAPKQNPITTKITRRSCGR